MINQRRGIWKFLTLVLALGLVFAACGGGGDTDEAAEETETTTEEQKTGGTVILAGEQEPTSLNWLTPADNAAWTNYVMGRLVWPGAYTANPENEKITNEALMESVELTDEDPQTVVYKINEDAVWSDGNPISADDFIFTWEAQNGKNEAYLAASTTGYEDIETLTASDGGKTVTVVFAKPFADWDALFEFVLPVKGFEAAGGGDKVKGFNEGYKVETLNLETVVSGGPYKVTDYQVGRSMTLERNEDYYGEPAFLDKILVPWITEASQQPAALENNEADVAFPQAQIDLVQQVRAIQGITADIGFGTFWEHMDFNFQNTHLAQLEVRQAIAKALDREEIVERLPGQFSDEARVLNNRIFKPGEGAYEENNEGYEEQSIADATELLEDAGYAKGADGIYAKGGEKLTLRVTWRDPNERRQQTAELVQSQLKEAGIEITLAPQPNFEFLDQGNFDIALFGWTGGTVLSSTTAIYVPEGGQNHAGHNNPKLQELYDQANVELDREARLEIMNEIDQLLWADMPTVPLFQVPELLAYRETVVGPEYNGYAGPAWNAANWSLK